MSLLRGPLQITRFVHAIESFLKIDEEQTQRRFKFRPLFQNDPQAVYVVDAGGSGAETSLLSVDQTFDMFFDAFQDYFRYYLCDSNRTPSIVTLKTDALLRNLNYHPVLSFSGKHFPRFLDEWKQQVCTHCRYSDK